MRHLQVITMSLLVLTAGPVFSTHGELLNAANFASLGVLPTDQGTYVIDTDGASMFLPNGASIQGLLYNGIEAPFGKIGRAHV